MNLKIGSKVKVNLPKPLPDWVDVQFPNWSNDLFLIDQQIVTIIKTYTNYPFIAGKFDCIDVAIFANSTSLLVGWFQILDDKTPCNCPISTILISGCKDKNHI